MTSELDSFARDLGTALGVEVDVDVAAVLSLASDAAHAYVRPAAPLATFLAGIAAGRAGATRESVEAALAAAADFCARPPEDLG
ncbi:MAG: DUF6457 domain-containing protein [Aeromicrobium sp.]